MVPCKLCGKNLVKASFSFNWINVKFTHGLMVFRNSTGMAFLRPHFKPQWKSVEYSRTVKHILNPMKYLRKIFPVTYILFIIEHIYHMHLVGLWKHWGSNLGQSSPKADVLSSSLEHQPQDYFDKISVNVYMQYWISVPFYAYF